MHAPVHIISSLFISSSFYTSADDIDESCCEYRMVYKTRCLSTLNTLAIKVSYVGLLTGIVFVHIVLISLCELAIIDSYHGYYQLVVVFH